MFPPDDKQKPKSGSKPPAKGGKPGQPGAPDDQQQQGGPGLHEALMRPQGPKPGQGMDPMQAMMGGMGDISQFGPPAPPAPGAPMGDGGMPIGGGLPSADPGMDPAMEGSGLFQALSQQLDPYAAPPEGHGELGDMGTGDPAMGLDELLAMLALARGGVGGEAMGGGGLNPSGQMNDATHPGAMVGMQNPNLMQ